MLESKLVSYSIRYLVVVSVGLLRGWSTCFIVLCVVLSLGNPLEPNNYVSDNDLSVVLY